MKKINADICIIGAGSGGLSLAAGAAQLGRKVVLIEKGEMGGDCLNTGCVPSKALISAANRAHAMRHASKFGIDDVAPSVNFEAVMDHVHGVIAGIAPHDSQERFEGLGVTVLRDHARFTGPRMVVAGETSVTAKHLVIATGSSPFVPPIDGLAETPYFTNETIFNNRTLPDHLIIIGGGPIGVEMAQAHQRLGAKVTLIEGRTILGKDDPELSDVVRQQLIEDGVTLKENASVTRVGSTDDAIKVSTDNETIVGSHLLIAVGRRANVDNMDLEKAGVAFTNRGITVDSGLRTSNKRIYAMGDVAGGRQFTHVAGYHASVLVRRILFKTPAKNNEHEAPWVTYSDPELANVGITEQEAQDKKIDHQVVRWALEENDRARAERDTRGLIKIITDKKGRVLGASVVGAGAGEIIQSWALAISNKMTVRAFTNYISPYPTRGEISKRVAGQYYTPTLFSGKTKLLVSTLSMFD